MPPREITGQILQSLGIGKSVSPTELSSISLLMHFAYGGAAGAGYGLYFTKASRASLIKGLGYGLFFWSLSYLGILPGLAVLKPATQHTAKRGLLMVAVHLLWGACLAIFSKSVSSEAKRTAGGLISNYNLPHFEANNFYFLAALRIESCTNLSFSTTGGGSTNG